MLVRITCTPFSPFPHHDLETSDTQLTRFARLVPQQSLELLVPGKPAARNLLPRWLLVKRLEVLDISRRRRHLMEPVKAMQTVCEGRSSNGCCGRPSAWIRARPELSMWYRGVVSSRQVWQPAGERRVERWAEPESRLVEYHIGSRPSGTHWKSHPDKCASELSP